MYWKELTVSNTWPHTTTPQTDMTSLMPANRNSCYSVRTHTNR